MRTRFIPWLAGWLLLAACGQNSPMRLEANGEALRFPDGQASLQLLPDGSQLLRIHGYDAQGKGCFINLYVGPGQSVEGDYPLGQGQRVQFQNSQGDSAIVLDSDQCGQASGQVRITRYDRQSGLISGHFEAKVCNTLYEQAENEALLRAGHFEDIPLSLLSPR